MKPTTNLGSLAERVDEIIPRDTGYFEDAKAGLALLRETGPTEFEASIYEPIVCLILQGEKVTTVGDFSLTIARGECVVVTHDLPVLARITQASARRPYLALLARLDLSILRGLDDELGDWIPREEAARSIEKGPVDAATVQVLERYLDLLDDPVGRNVLIPLVRKELHFRLFLSSSGAMLRSLLKRDSHASNIGRAIDILRRDYRAVLDVSDLAKAVGMSPSSFHKHFKAVTHTTPLQYQKDLRLTEARRLLRGGEHSVSSAAFEVGYESSSQFSREYSRKFHAAPRSDLRVA